MYGRILRPIYWLVFKLLGWKIIGKKCDYKKYIIVAAPHTSNWDFMLGLITRSLLRFKAWFAGKSELFKAPYGFFFKKWGGYPVYRDKNTNFVQSLVNTFNEKTEFNICIAPEGTRKYNPEWKTGFWHIANLANIPIMMVAMDYSKKEIRLAEPFFTSNIEKDISFMKAYFRTAKGKYPENGVRD